MKRFTHNSEFKCFKRGPKIESLLFKEFALYFKNKATTVSKNKVANESFGYTFLLRTISIALVVIEALK